MVALPQIVGTIENWPTYLRDCFQLLGPGKTIIYLRDGKKLQIRNGTSDGGVIYELFIRQDYISPLLPQLKQTDIVVDIGAQIGVFTLAVAKQVKRVYSFEPEPQNFGQLTRNLTLNKLKNVTAHKMAVAAKAETKRLHLFNFTSHSFYPGVEGRTTIAVKTTTLANIMRECRLKQIDLLKLDVEGAEYEILFSTPAPVLAKVKAITMEFHDLDNVRNGHTLQRFLEKHGFSTKISTWPTKMLYAVRS